MSTIIGSVLAAFLATCGVDPDQPDQPDQPDRPDLVPPNSGEDPLEYFCCMSIDLEKDTGEGCVTIAQTQVDACSEVLTCEKFSKSKGTTYCK
jgi:hypothetical protein